MRSWADVPPFRPLQICLTYLVVFFVLVGYSAIPQSMSILFEWWKDAAHVARSKEVWMMSFFSVIWNIWIARNNLFFFWNKESSTSQVMDLVKLVLDFGSRHWFKVAHTQLLAYKQPAFSFIDGSDRAACKGNFNL